jgi:UDP-glucose 4-epimerase
MSILVTGAAGFIGSHTALELLQTGYEVVAVDNLSNASIDSLQNVQRMAGKRLIFYCLDLLNHDALAKIFDRHQIDAVLHLAGFKDVLRAERTPLRSYFDNVVGTANLCDVMVGTACRRLVFASSAAVYGRSATSCLLENAICSPSNAYGRTKLMAEHMLQDLSAADSKWSVIILRYFNVAGAHRSGRLAESSTPLASSLFARIAQSILDKHSILKICGDDYPTMDGSPVRDYVHVKDVAYANLSALRVSQSKSGVLTSNIGTGNAHSVFEVIAQYEHVCGESIPFEITERRPIDVAECVNGSLRALVDLQWQPSLSLDEICRDSWRAQCHSRQ